MNPDTYRRRVATIAVALVLAFLTAGAPAGVSAGSPAGPSLAIDRVTTTLGDEPVTGVVSGQPVELHLQYSGLGDGVHAIEIRDAASGTHVVDATVVGDSGSENVGIDGDALAPAVDATPSTVELQAVSANATSGRHSLGKIERATFYLTGVPQEAGGNATVNVTYYGWAGEAVSLDLVADAAPLGDDTGEDVVIDSVDAEGPTGSSATRFRGTISFSPGSYRPSPSSDAVVIQLREAVSGAEPYRSNGERIALVNTGPTAEFEVSPARPRIGQPVTFDASASRDPDGTVVRYEWDFDGDGTVDATGPEVARTFGTGGQRTVSLTVTDDAGRTSTLRVRVPVVALPEAVVEYDPTDPVARRPVTFDASASRDPDGTVERYEWDFDADGTTDAVGPTVNHTFREGDHAVVLTVTDDDGATNSTRLHLAVAPLVRPSANLAYEPDRPAANGTVTFDAGGSADPDGRIVRYRWTFGDGTTENSTEPVVRHVYREGGNYSVTLTVVDDDRAAATSRATVPVNDPPVLRVEPSTTAPARNESVTFDASGSTDPDGEIAEFRWEFGDGTAANTGDAVVTHTYRSYGTYAVRIVVTDDDGATRSRTLSIGVENRMPTAAFQFQPGRPRVGKGVRFDASRSGDPDGTVERYRWDFDGDGVTDETGAVVTHSFDGRGAHEVTLVVEDGAGGTNATTKEVQVGPVVPWTEAVLIAVFVVWALAFLSLSGQVSIPRPGRGTLSIPRLPIGSGGDDEPTDDSEGDDGTDRGR